ncbi:MAG TPA: DUF4440 domain-containing protein [Bacteroidales bacterium]|jgi:uncharacterized protein (TIGR02246 family)|nr:DUF4440 domain-containing protein [Bacteroidales bacterium]
MKDSFLKSVILIVAVAFTASVAAQENEELKAKIEKINKEMQVAMLNGNTDAVMANYSEDAISLPSYSKMAQGIEAIKKMNEQMMSSGMKITKFETETIMVSTCENNIAEIGTYNMSFTTEGTPGEMSDTGKYLTIWEQQPDGSLKIAVEMWNTDTFPTTGM